MSDSVRVTDVLVFASCRVRPNACCTFQSVSMLQHTFEFSYTQDMFDTDKHIIWFRNRTSSKSCEQVNMSKIIFSPASIAACSQVIYRRQLNQGRQRPLLPTEGGDHQHPSVG